ncbi:hypothetical protein ABZX77_30540 [Streptomyces sp. NPDC004237]|uniref:hypothetical protein n=1 Tax=Streptomyces sp. NPDC004237 TaxID=3154455 RepID=UPI0033A4701B
MSRTVIMRHPTLPPAQEIEVPRDAMAHYTGAGWQQVPAEELEARAELKAKAEAEARAAEEAAEQPPESTEQAEPAQTPEAPAAPTKPARSRAKAPENEAGEN